MSDSADRQVSKIFTLADICRILDAKVICGEDKLDQEIRTACGCDLMSDVLAFTHPGSVLLTGLTNQQVVRTAEMLDLAAVVIVRDKQPDETTVELARSKGLPILMSPHPLYESCGMLYTNGLMGCNGSRD
ncbi:MAG: DRTGG domain-containing protein [Armatimonadota bacterium]